MIRISPLLAATVLASASFGCRSRSASGSASTPPAPASQDGSLHYDDSRFAFDYPADFKVAATSVGSDEWLTITPKVPPGGTTDGVATVQPDPVHPDMLLNDELASYTKTLSDQSKRVFGGVRSLPSKNGTCKGLVEIDPWKPCPANAPFKPASGDCFDAMLSAFCATSGGKRLIYASQLGPVPTADQLTPEAASYGRAHERILSTLEFK